MLFLFAFCLAVPFAEAAGKKASPEAQVAATNNETYNTNLFLYTTPEQERKPFSIFFTVLQTLVILVVVGFILYYFLKFIMRKQGTGNINKELIRVISQNSVAVGKYISIVRIMSHFYILSISDNQVALIERITERDEIDRLKVLESELPVSQDITFADYLQELAKPIIGKKETVAGESSDGILNFLKKQKERLSKLNGEKK
jgi:flagellar biogenesis protein FliO